VATVYTCWSGDVCAALPVRGGTGCTWSINSTDDANLGEKGERVEATLREFLEQLLVNSQNRLQP
jgi:hypothetical protein